ncbi:hypothetical protein T484DRAFT_3455213 [Baffinella frigidus]|nr:hypothetical protein T484DRAFT_3455213 [Cryptophyta sp. CCMP2293]
MHPAVSSAHLWDGDRTNQPCFLRQVVGVPLQVKQEESPKQARKMRGHYNQMHLPNDKLLGGGEVSTPKMQGN